MPESALLPDFEAIAARLVDGLRTAAVDAAAWTRPERPPDTAAPPAVIEALRQVWNARGAEDLAAIDGVAHTNDVANAIRGLDR